MYYDGQVHIEEDDLCYSCEYFVKGVNCPLLEALALGVVNLDTDIVVQTCGFYKEFKRNLRLVDLSSARKQDVPFHPDTESTVDFIPDDSDSDSSPSSLP